MMLSELARAFGGPAGRATMKASPEDFIVREQLSFSLADEGQHVWLHIRKRGRNTAEVARMLRELAQVRPVDIGFAGMKDRNAVTEQWFSVDLKGAEEPDWRVLDDEFLNVLEIRRHRRKLKRGGHKGNAFELLLRDFSGDPGNLSAIHEQLLEHGAPNYFGAQRFGRDGDNTDAARRWFAGGRAPRSRNLRGLLLSAARSALFNQVLDARVRDGSWNGFREGDVMMLDGSTRTFPAAVDDAAIASRLAAQDIHPTGPLPGRGDRLSGEAGEFERAVLARDVALVDGLVAHRVDSSRRALRVSARDFALEIDGSDIYCRFTLPAGAYATVAIRELFDTGL